MKKSNNVFRNVLRILGTVAALGYILFFIGEGVPHFKEITFADISVYLLFAVFVLGYYFLWKNEIISGILLIAWHLIQYCLVFWVWPDGGMTIILGIPIGIFGIVVLIYGVRKKVSSKNIRRCLIIFLISLIVLYLLFLVYMSFRLGLWN
jgi:hypothetical protein